MTLIHDTGNGTRFDFVVCTTKKESEKDELPIMKSLNRIRHDDY